MKIDDITRLKILAGITDTQGNKIQTEDNISDIGTNRAEYQRKHKIKPGTDEWFKLWFAKPKLTGENPTPKD